MPHDDPDECASPSRDRGICRNLVAGKLRRGLCGLSVAASNLPDPAVEWDSVARVPPEQESMPPTIYRERGYRFFFFSREEPRTLVHVICAWGESKFWLDPTIELARSIGMNDRQLHQAKAIIEEHGDEFRAAWHRHFDG